MNGAGRIDAERVIADLAELARRTSDGGGAQRLCWTETWSDARGFLRELLSEIGLEADTDEAGNLWARLNGEDPDAGAVVVGSHVDSVPDGGRLDGALGIMAAIGVLRAHADETPPRSLVLVDWADEEGARFGLSLFGSSAFADTLDASAAAELRDADGRTMKEVLAENGVEIERASKCAARREGLAVYLELHIEQGPVMEAEGVTVAAVTGCQGIERLRFNFTGQAAHAGTTPMAMRRDAGLAAAGLATRIAELPARYGGVATTGELRLEPGISTAVAGASHLTCDLRNPDVDGLAAMHSEARAAAHESASEHGCEVAEEPIFRIAPTVFDANLVAAAKEACQSATGGEAFTIASGALHDAASASRVMPAAMMFCPSRGGLSHAAEEDTSDDDLREAIECFGALVERVLKQ
ncbi:MAG: Zn-dependent hydrolase [Actinomycetota bacterium]|nr:Zn-dependent hydrolase [Actinomycetota bacterium]